MPYRDPFSPYSPFSRPPRLPWTHAAQDPAWRDALSTGETLGATGLGWALSLLAGGAGGTAFFGPVGAALPHIIHDLTGQDRAYDAAKEYMRNVLQYRVDLPQRLKGAEQLSGLASLHTPEDIKTSAEWAALGLMGNPEQEADHIAHRHVWTSGHPELVADFMAHAPELKEKNWQAYLDTMDAAAQRNIDMTPVGYTPAVHPEDFQTELAGRANVSAFEAPTFEAPRHAFNVLDPNSAIAAADAYFGIEDPHAGGGRSLVDEATGAGAAPVGGYSEAELAGMGFKPGRYQEAMRNYLIAHNPQIASDTRFGSIFDPTVEAPGGLSADQISANDSAFEQQVADWKRNLREQNNLWQQQWQRYAAEAQQAWTSGGS